jgi:hypothetical protein
MKSDLVEDQSSCIAQYRDSNWRYNGACKLCRGHQPKMAYHF